MSWLDPSELRIGLGCMRLPADEQLALDTILAASARRHNGVRYRARVRGRSTGLARHNERLLAARAARRRSGAAAHGSSPRAV